MKDSLHLSSEFDFDKYLEKLKVASQPYDNLLKYF